jgi:hypothetical protein
MKGKIMKLKIMQRADERFEAFCNQHRTIGFFLDWHRTGYWIALSVGVMVIVACQIFSYARTGQFIPLPGFNK